jgi:hypothetical protein
MEDLSQSDTPALKANGEYRTVEEMIAGGVEFLHSPTSPAPQKLIEVPVLDLDAVSALKSQTTRSGRIVIPAAKALIIAQQQAIKNFPSAYGGSGEKVRMAVTFLP